MVVAAAVLMAFVNDNKFERDVDLYFDSDLQAYYQNLKLQISAAAAADL